MLEPKAAHLRAINGGEAGASTAKTTKAEPYRFDSTMERAAVVGSCCSATLWGTIGRLLEPESLDSAPAKLLLTALRDYVQEHGNVPGAWPPVVQALHTRMNDGKVSWEQIQEVNVYCDEWADTPAIPEEAICNTLAPTFVRHASTDIVHTAIRAHASGDAEAFAAVAKKAAAIPTIGKQNRSLGTHPGGQTFRRVASVGLMNRLATGIKPFDDLIHNGLPKGLTTFLGTPKAGKSMVLDHIATEVWSRGEAVCLATLELSEAVHEARIMANLLGIQIDTLLESEDHPMADERFEEIKHHMGFLSVKHFKPAHSTVEQIHQWHADEEQAAGHKIPTLIVDYADLVQDPRAKDGEYLAQRNIYNDLRDHAEARGGYTVTACASKDTKDARQKLDIQHAADSKHKSRVPELFVCLRYLEESDMMDYFIGCARMDQMRVGSGPLSLDKARGRMAPVSRPWGW